MKELRQVRDAVIHALRDGGLAAEAAFPSKWAAGRNTALASVCVGTAEDRALGFCGYLGETQGRDGQVREVYGKRLEGIVNLDIRAEGAAACEAGAETAATVLLEKLPEALRPGGRAAILTFHSGEDRLVKKSLKHFQKEGLYSQIASDAIRPSAEECRRNSRARSTKLRWAVRAQ